jgi:HEAT repeat protein
MPRWIMWIAMLLGACSLSRAQAPQADDVGQQVEDHLADMTTHGSAYDPKGLHELGLPGLEALLDRLFPETAPARKPVLPPDDAEVRRLIGLLASEDFKTREQATEQLIEKGKPHEELLAKAADNDDAEVRLRARRILAAWMPREPAVADQSLGGFWKYAEGIQDHPRLMALAKRTALVLDRGYPEGSHVHLTRLCIAGVAHGGAEEPCQVLRPLLEHKDVRVAKLVVETIGSYKPKDFFPKLLVEALSAKRDEVVEVAVRWCQHASGLSRSAEIQSGLRNVFDRRSEALKFQSCLALTQDFDEPDAWHYLILQTQSKEPLRAASALARLADASHSGRAASSQLLEKIDPHLRSPQLHVRWGAAKVIGMHAGQEVIERLIPLLADAEQSVVDEVRRALAKQADKPLVRRLVAQAAADHADPMVRTRCNELLAKLSGK